LKPSGWTLPVEPSQPFQRKSSAGGATEVFRR
jgi:hypothetical protein